MICVFRIICVKAMGLLTFMINLDIFITLQVILVDFVDMLGVIGLGTITLETLDACKRQHAREVHERIWKRLEGTMKFFLTYNMQFIQKHLPQQRCFPRVSFNAGPTSDNIIVDMVLYNDSMSNMANNIARHFLSSKSPHIIMQQVPPLVYQ